MRAVILPRTFVLLQNLFQTDVLYLNHRNYSARSTRLANNASELANDVISFVHYYLQRKRIVLYGMCGGAATMTLVADQLSKKESHIS